MPDIMLDLPQGWELDYDGSRWIYRFTASGLTQYQFPKPGDEFPEFVGDGSFFDMAPEDRLASDKQAKRQGMERMEIDPTAPPVFERKKGSLEDIEEVEAAEYLDPEKFMYLGPGSVSGSNTLGGQQACIKPEAKHFDPECQQTPSSTKQRGEEVKETLTDWLIVDCVANGDSDTTRRPPPVTADASKEAKPREGNAISAPSVQPKLRMQSPVGFMAELPSHKTRKQRDVEPDVPMHSIGIVELPSLSKPIKTKQPRSEEARLASALLATSYPLVSASFAYPPLPPKQPIYSPKTAGFCNSATLPQKPFSQEMARPLSCHETLMERGGDPCVKPNANETRFASMPEVPTLDRLTGVTSQEPKRRSIQGLGPVATSPSGHPMPPMLPSDVGELYSSGFQYFQNRETIHPAPHVPPKIPLSPAGVKADSLIHDTIRTQLTEARHENISPDVSRAYTSRLTSSGLAQCPSVLRPGYYQSSAIGPPQRSQQFSTMEASEMQQPHRRHLPHILPVQHSHHTHRPATLEAPVKPRWHGGGVLEGPAVRMPDERDFTVRPTTTTMAASEPAIVSSPTTVSSPKSPSNGPGFMILHQIGPTGPTRDSRPDPITSCTQDPRRKVIYELGSGLEPRRKVIHELGSGKPLPVELPAEASTGTKRTHPLPSVAPLRLSPSASRLRSELPASVARATQELAGLSLVPREHSWSTPDLSSSVQADANTRYCMSGTTAGTGHPHHRAPKAVDTRPLKPAPQPALSRSMEGANSASLPGLQDPSPLTRPASWAQSEVSSPSASNASLHQVPIPTPTSGLRPFEAPSTRQSASRTVPRYANTQTAAQGQQTAGFPPGVVKATGKGVWSTTSVNYSGDEWGQNWYEECPGVVPEDHLPS